MGCFLLAVRRFGLEFKKFPGNFVLRPYHSFKTDRDVTIEMSADAHPKEAKRLL